MSDKDKQPRPTRDDRDAKAGATATTRDGHGVFSRNTVRIDGAGDGDARTPGLGESLDAAGLRRLGDSDYALAGELGRGGMGQVLQGTDVRLGRSVAVKRLLTATATSEARFVREMLITARLQHPSIVPVYDAGRWEDGQLVYAMRRYQGRTLAECLGDEGLEGRLAHLGSITAAAEAIAYAHEEGVIHRDLKPSNLIVGDFGETIVIDWGLAKLRDGPDTESGEAEDSSDGQLTQAGSTVGTPRYMSPEQSCGEPATTKSDVYALGVCLYELLTKELPGDEVGAGYPETPPAPLLAICLAAIADDPATRPSAKELAAELRRFQAGALVGLHDYTTLDLIRRFLSRHRLATVIASISFIVVIALVVWLAFESRARARAIESLIMQSDELALASSRSTAAADPLGALRTLARLSSSEPAWQRARMILGAAALGGLPRHVARVPAEATTLDLLGTTLIASSSGHAWLIDPATRTVSKRALPVEAERISIGHWLGWRDSTLVVFDAEAGTTVVAHRFPRRPRAVSASNDGRAVAAVDEDGAIVRYRGTPIIEMPGARRAVVSPDGTAAALQGAKGAAVALAVYALPGGELVHHRDSLDSEIVELRMTSNSMLLMKFASGFQQQLDPAGISGAAAACDPEPVLVWRGSNHACVRGDAVRVHRSNSSLPATEVTDLELADGRELIVASSLDGTAKAWNFRGRLFSTLSHPTGVLAAALEANGLRAFTLDADGVIRQWDLSHLTDVALTSGIMGMKERAHARTHSIGGVIGQDPSLLLPGDRGTAIVAVGEKLYLGHGEEAPAELIELPEGLPRLLAVDARGRWLAVAVATDPRSGPTTLHVVDLDSRAVHASRELAAEITDVELVRNLDTVVAGMSDGRVVRLGVDGELEEVARADGPIRAVAAKGSQTVFAVAGSHEIRLVTGDATRVLGASTTAITDLDVSPARDEIIVAAKGRALLLWETGGQMRRLPLDGSFPSARFSPSGERVAAFGPAGVRLVDRESGEYRDLTPNPSNSVVFVSGALIHTNGSFSFRARDDLPIGAAPLRRWIKSRLDAAAGSTAR